MEDLKLEEHGIESSRNVKKQDASPLVQLKRSINTCRLSVSGFPCATFCIVQTDFRTGIHVHLGADQNNSAIIHKTLPGESATET
jgi:hypothetical protein